MFLALTLLLLGAAPHPLEGIRLTQMQMFELQKEYRYHVQIVEMNWHAGLNRYQADTTDYYARTIREFRATAPQGRAIMNGTAILIQMVLDDVLMFPDDRYHFSDGYVLEHDGPVILVIEDRQEHIGLWPQKKADP